MSSVTPVEAEPGVLELGVVPEVIMKKDQSRSCDVIVYNSGKIKIKVNLFTMCFKIVKRSILTHCDLFLLPQ